MSNKSMLGAVIISGLLLFLSLSTRADPLEILKPVRTGPGLNAQDLGTKYGTYLCVNNTITPPKTFKMRRCFCPTDKIVRGDWVCDLVGECSPCPFPTGEIGLDTDPVCDATGRDLIFDSPTLPSMQPAVVNVAQTPEECWEQGGISFTDDLLRGTTTCHFPSGSAISSEPSP